MSVDLEPPVTMEGDAPVKRLIIGAVLLNIFGRI